MILAVYQKKSLFILKSSNSVSYLMKSCLSNPCLMTLATRKLSWELTACPEVLNSRVREMCSISLTHPHCNGVWSKCSAPCLFLGLMLPISTYVNNSTHNRQWFIIHLPGGPQWTSVDLDWLRFMPQFIHRMQIVLPGNITWEIIRSEKGPSDVWSLL